MAAQLSENVARYDIPAAPDGSFPALFTRCGLLVAGWDEVGWGGGLNRVAGCTCCLR